MEFQVLICTCYCITYALIKPIRASLSLIKCLSLISAPKLQVAGELIHSMCNTGSSTSRDVSWRPTDICCLRAMHVSRLPGSLAPAPLGHWNKPWMSKSNGRLSRTNTSHQYAIPRLSTDFTSCSIYGNASNHLWWSHVHVCVSVCAIVMCIGHNTGLQHFDGRIVFCFKLWTLWCHLFACWKQLYVHIYIYIVFHMLFTHVWTMAIWHWIVREVGG